MLSQRPAHAVLETMNDPAREACIHPLFLGLKPWFGLLLEEVGHGCDLPESYDIKYHAE